MSEATTRSLSPSDPDFRENVFRAFCDNEKDRIMSLWVRSSGTVRIQMANIQEADTRRTPLHYCAERGHTELTQFLAETAGADINAVDHLGWSPLHAACSAGQTVIVYYLLKCGAKVHLVTSSGCIALNYFVRHCMEKSRTLTIACLALLVPSPAHLRATNSRSESLLHYACLNNSNNMPFFVTFLMDNGVDPTIKNKRGAECWEFLTPPKKYALSKYVNPSHYCGAKLDEDAIQGYDSFKPDPEMEEEPPIEIEYQPEEEDDQTKLLRELLTIRVNLQSLEPGNPIAERALEAVENALELQRPKGVASSLHKLERKSTEYCEGLLRAKNVMLNNRTSRQMISEGKMMICINQEEQTYQHVYYFLYNDCWVIFDDQQANGEEFTEDDLLRVIPLTHLYCFYIPENQGIPHGIQVVFYPVADSVRSTFTILMPSEKRKEELIKEVQDAFQEITRSYITVPLNEVPDDDQVVHQGYLVMKGIVINFHLRVYVRLTTEFLYYYESETSYTIMGKILIKNVTSRFDKKRKMIKWMTKEGRSFCFYALNQTDFHHWTKRMRGEEPTPVLDGLEDPPSNMRVDITIMAGRDILSKDANGYSDPYCIVGLCDSEGRFLRGATKYKTQTQYKTLKPDWTANNRFVFDPVHDGQVCSLRVDMWDEDKLSSDDFIGHAIITPARFYDKKKEVVDWVKLTSRPGRDEKVEGDVCVRVAVAYDD